MCEIYGGYLATTVNCIIAPVEFCRGYRYFNKKKKYSYDRCPHPVYFNISLLIIYLSAIGKVICPTEIGVDRVYFLRFCTKYDTGFSKFGNEFMVALSSTTETTIGRKITRLLGVSSSFEVKL